MTIKIFPPKRGGVSAFDTTFALQQDNWNDYSFQTLYHLYHQQEAGHEPTLIGPVKILKRGQTGSDRIQITEDFDQLANDFCSVGVTLDYYYRLNKISQGNRNQILEALRDVVYQPNLQDDFRNEEGWLTSLFRGNSNYQDYLIDAKAILTGNFGALPDIEQCITFHPKNWSSPLTLSFDTPEPTFYLGPRRQLGPSGHATLLPRRIIVVIGRNGSGKSTLLARMARVGFASPTDRARNEVKNIGTFDPASIGFIKIIAISYSPFDNFIVPGLYETELRQIANDIEKSSGRYVYAGIRDIVSELQDDLEAAQDQEYSEDEDAMLVDEDRRKSTRLKSLAQLADEFQRLINQVSDNNNNLLLKAALEPILSELSVLDVESGHLDRIRSEPRTAFFRMSTGYKLALHVVASLVAHTTRKSLVLFDEPELHLHPPLIAALMQSIRIILEEKDAFAVVATHSPVILQETMARHVRIIHRVVNDFSILTPSTETFGENVGALTYDSFGLKAETTDFHQYLDLLIQGFDNVDEINELFTKQLSGQALSYVMSGLARKTK